MNKWLGQGRLVREAAVRFTESGKCVATFTLACNYIVNGNQRAEFIRCVAWEKTAEIIGECCRKGDKILVEGRLQTRRYEKDGEKRWITEIIVNHMEFCESRKSKGGAPAEAEEPYTEEDMENAEDTPPLDIPF